MACILIFCLLGWLMAGGALADPAEAPPPDFTSRQYIDSTGCVFLRSDQGWEARLDPDGVPICGYPPTLSALRAKTDPLAEPDPALAMPGMGEAEARLLAAVAGEMRPGDFVGAPPPSASPAPTPPPAPRGPATDPRHQLDAALVTAPQIAAASTVDLHPDARLCALLGTTPATEGPGALGQDPTGGYCAAALLSAPQVPSVPVVAAPAIAAPEPARPKVAAAGKPKAAAPRAAPTRQSGPAMIPASARWLEVGRFATPAEADTAAARLSARGFAVARAPLRGGTAIMAGPFTSRQAIVSARDRLIRLGYRGLRVR